MALKWCRNLLLNVNVNIKCWMLNVDIDKVESVYKQVNTINNDISALI